MSDKLIVNIGANIEEFMISKGFYKNLALYQGIEYILLNTPATPMGRKVYAHLWRVSNFGEDRREIR